MNQDKPISKEQPLISVIVPVYNAEKYLPKCIESIQNQTYRNLEIILVNDGSTDNSLAICYQYSEKDKRIIVITQENKGVSSARNSGLDIATGDYIGFVDSDDYIAPDMYEQLLSACLENDADISECGYYIVSESDKIISSSSLKNGIVDGKYESSKAYVLRENTTPLVWNKLYRRRILERVKYSNFRYADDVWFNSRAFYECQRKITISECYYYHLRHKKSTMNAPFKAEKLEMIEAAKDVYEFYKTRFEDLCPYAVLYIVWAIIAIYNNLKETAPPDIQKKCEPILVKEFKNYYKLIKGEAYESIKFRNPHIAYFLFNISPGLYYVVYKLYQKIK
jgi:glycosyltransferase involved in cell wall biosynthesis